MARCSELIRTFQEEKRLTSPPSKARTHPKPPPSAKDTPKEVKPPANSLPDLTTISKPGKPKHGGGPKQHTVVSYGTRCHALIFQHLHACGMAMP